MSYYGSKGKGDEIDSLVSKRLRTRRIMLGLSQHELGSIVDVSIQQIQKYEKGINRVSSGKLYKFAKILNVPINYFFDKTNTKNQEVFSEEHEEYRANNATIDSIIQEKELVSLAKAFNEISCPKIRKKVLELVKSMAS